MSETTGFTNPYALNSLQSKYFTTKVDTPNSIATSDLGSGLKGSVFDTNYQVPTSFGDTMKTGAQVVGAISGLANAYTGWKGMKLAKDQFNYNKALTNTNLANQASLINENRMNAANVGLGLAGNTMTEAQKTAARDKITASNVSGKVG